MFVRLRCGPPRTGRTSTRRWTWACASGQQSTCDDRAARRYLSPEANSPAWYQAHSHPVVGPALRMLHDDPARPWTVAKLAADLLREPAATIGSVARQVGYGSSFALSTAFNRVRGIAAYASGVRQRLARCPGCRPCF
jgi:AraC-like DNA-binding protein